MSFTTNAGSGGATFASHTETVSPQDGEVPLSKIMYGPEGSGVLVTASVGLPVAGVGSFTVTNAGTFAVQAACTNAGTFVVQENGAALTSLQLIDDGIATVASAITTKGMAAVGTDGTNARILKTDSSGELQIDVLTLPALATGSNVIGAVTQSGSWSVTVSGTVTVGSHAVTNAGTFAVQASQVGNYSVIGASDHDDPAGGTPVENGFRASAAAPTDVSEDNDAVSGWALRNGAQCIQSTYAGILAVAGNGASGTGVQRVTIANDSTGILAGVTTVTTVTTVSTVTTCSTVTTLTGSAVAHDAADSGNPHKIGAKATAAMTGRTLVAADDRSDLFSGLDGVLINRPHAPLEDQLQETKSNTDGASTAMTSGFAAPGANIRLYLTTLIIANSSASNITVDIRDGSAGSVLATVPVPANGGVVINLPVPLKFTANTAAAFDGSAAASTLYVTMIGFKSKAG